MTDKQDGITDAERAKRRAAIDFARHSVRLEGITLPAAMEAINQAFVEGGIDDAGHVRQCLELIDAA